VGHSRRPLSTPGTARRTLPFAIAALLWFGSLLAPPGVERPTRLLVPAAIAVVIVLAAWRVPWRRLPAWTEALPPLAFFIVIGLVRQGYFRSDENVLFIHTGGATALHAYERELLGEADVAP